MRENPRSYLKLSKPKIALFSALSSGAAFTAASHRPDIGIIAPVAGVFILACGSSALNQFQERDIDSLMERTKNRPLPSGRILPLHALYFSLVMIFTGLGVLLSTGNAFAPVLGLFAVVWYNAVYTPLKRRSAFAAVPGALTGAVPPAIGWVAGGGGLHDPKLLAVCFFFFLWQIPHFWLLLMPRGDEYEKAGLPSIERIFGERRSSRVISHWIFSTSVASLFLSFYGVVRSPVITFSLILASLWLACKGIRLLRQGGDSLYTSTFRRINMYALLVMVLVSVDTFIHRACR